MIFCFAGLPDQAAYMALMASEHMLMQLCYTVLSILVGAFVIAFVLYCSKSTLSFA